jgi:spore maturation protein CgeB
LLVNWGTDDSWKYGQFARWVAPQFDVYATTSPDALRKAQRDGLKNFRLSQWAANSAYLREPLRASDCRYPVSFIGSAYGNRPRWIAGLSQRGIPVACFGYGWESGPVDSKEIPEIIRQSTISLNFADSGIVLNGAIPSRTRQIKARVFEVPGAGGFLLTEPAPGLGDFYVPGREVAIFTGLEDLCGQIRRFVSEPELRDAMALAGYRRTVSDHTYEHRFAELLGSCKRLSTPRLRPPAETGNLFDAIWFDTLMRRHRLTAGLSLLKRILVAICSVLWGPARGARAARRIVFELSWRILRGRTYSAAGLPGRMFYRES